MPCDSDTFAAAVEKPRMLDLRIINRIEACRRTSAFRDIECRRRYRSSHRIVRDTSRLVPGTVPETACVLMPSTPFVCLQGAARLNSNLGGAAVACLGAEALQRRSYGRRRSGRQARRVTCRRRRAFLLLPIARWSGLDGRW